MSLKSIITKIGDSVLTGVIRVAYVIWAIGTHVVYLPKKTFKTPEVKKLLNSPCIIIANHTSHTDGSFIPQVFIGKKINVLVTTKWYNKKGLNVFFKHLRYIPIDLKEGDTEWLSRCQEKLEKGESVLIFPEGKLSKTGELLEFQPGVLLLARRSNVPIIPMAVTGGYRKFHRQCITVGNPLEIDLNRKGRPSVILKEGAAYARAYVQELLNEAANK